VDTPDSESVSRRPGAAPGRWRFGAFELDETTGCLHAAGNAHPLDHGSYGVLLALLRHAGALVGKETLLQAGWPGRVVSENSLPKAIGRLRQLLDDPEGELLRTAHGYGYRLATRAEWSAPEPAAKPLPEAPRVAPAPATVPALPTAVAPPRRDSMPALLVVLAVLIATLAWLSWREAREARQLAAATSSAAPIPEGASIAVLPFEDLSQAHDQRYFADGLTDELLDRLAKLPQLSVASRTSTFALRDSEDSVQDIAHRLGVANVLEGSVRRDGDRVRITVQLINARDGFHLWSESYDQQFTNLFAVQDDIARSVVSALRLRLLPGQDAAVTRHRTRSAAAYAEFLAGDRFKYLNTPDNDRRAIAAYERAISLDPDFSTAYASLADMLGGDVRWADSPAEVIAAKRRSLQLMDKAIALEGDNPNLYLSRADFLYYTRRDFRAAQRDLDVAARLLRRRPPELLMRQTRLLAVLGRLDAAVALEREAIQADPHSPWAWGQLGYHLAAQGHYPEAHQALATALQIRPDDDHLGYYDGLAWLLEGRSRLAIASFERSGSVFRLAGLAAAHHDAGDAAASAQALQTLESRYAPGGAYQVAQAHAWRGEADAAFAWLARAEQQEDAGLAQLKFDPMFRRLHGDPRYPAWLKRLGLDEGTLSKQL
jgi:TolB-like protein/DNA-binding winged helix-turn-helix (wHTH) protein